jgi:hypothetical protein
VHKSRKHARVDFGFVCHVRVYSIAKPADEEDPVFPVLEEKDMSAIV